MNLWRVPIGLWAVTAIVLAVTLAVDVQRRRQPLLYAGMTPVRVALHDRTDMSASFTGVWSEPHYVALSFPRQVADPGAERLIALAADVRTPKSERPPFDLEWRAVEGSTEVGRGSGHSGPNGMLHGEGRTLKFGEFPVQSGHVYAIDVSLGPGFGPSLAASASLEVGVNRAGPSIGLALEREFIGPVEFLLGTIGVILLCWTIAVTRREWQLTRRPTPERDR